MPQAARLGDICSGHGCFPSRPNIQGSPDVIVENRPLHRQGDAWQVHCCKSCHAGNLASGSSTVIANGRQAGRIGDPVNCGSRVVTGASTVIIGG